MVLISEMDRGFLTSEIDLNDFTVEIFFLDVAFVVLKFLPSDPIFSPTFKIFFFLDFGLKLFWSLYERGETNVLVSSPENLTSLSFIPRSVFLFM